MTVWTARNAGDLVINVHDEDDPTADQELFLVLSSHAVVELDGDRVDAPAGTLVFAPPSTKRTVSATQAGTTIIAVEGTPGKAYEARGWELWALLAPHYEAGEYAEVADRLGALVAASPTEDPPPEPPDVAGPDGEAQLAALPSASTPAARASP